MVDTLPDGLGLKVILLEEGKAMFKMVPLRAALVDEGEFLENIDAAIDEGMRVLDQHRRKYGDESHKATFEVDAKLKFIITNANDGSVAIKAKVDTKPPKRPESVTTGIAHNDEGGKPSLFVQVGGSHEDDPRQMKLSTDDGRTVDNEAGTVEPRG